jgi:hypothetical protein
VELPSLLVVDIKDVAQSKIVKKEGEVKNK